MLEFGGFHSSRHSLIRESPVKLKTAVKTGLARTETALYAKRLFR